MSDEHLGGCYIDVPDSNIFMEDVWCHLIEKYQIKSVIDIGAGAGWTTQWFNTEGVLCIGIEGWPEALKHKRHPFIVEHDYTKGPLNCGFADLAWMAEVVEHIEEQYIPNWIETVRCCRYFCMTHGEPGQIGFHHVTLHDSDWWRAKLKEYRFTIDEVETAYLRSTDKWHAAWGRRTLMFFRNERFASPKNVET